jgi:uncharacterized Fe-S cluster-containing protein
MKAELTDGAPVGSGSVFHASGWVQTNIVTVWFDHIIKVTKPISEQPMLLVLDGHLSHTRTHELLRRREKSCRSSLFVTTYITLYAAVGCSVDASTKNILQARNGCIIIQIVSVLHF